VALGGREDFWGRGARPGKYACVVRLEKMFRNPIIEAVEKGGLAPRECTFDFNDDGGCCITQTASGSSFVLEGPFGHHTTTTVVGEGQPQQLEAFIWPTVVERVERWARDVKLDVDTPDLLAELQRERDILTGTRYEEVGNAPFSSEELAEIAEQLRQVKEHVSTAYALSEVQMLHLEAKLDDIEAAARRMGRKDWALWVSGALLGTFVQAVLPPEVLHHIIRMTVDGLGYLLGGGGTPPLLPPIT
jgi:DNA-binding Lrp family transcriptional regulator